MKNNAIYHDRHSRHFTDSLLFVILCVLAGLFALSLVITALLFMFL